MRGERLAYIRDKRGFTQAELAERLGLGVQQIYRYENGKTQPDGEIVARIALFLGVSTDYLLGLTDYPTPHIEAELTDAEREALTAWRRGEKYEAIRLIVNSGT